MRPVSLPRSPRLWRSRPESEYPQRWRRHAPDRSQLPEMPRRPRNGTDCDGPLKDYITEPAVSCLVEDGTNGEARKSRRPRRLPRLPPSDPISTTRGAGPGDPPIPPGAARSDPQTDRQLVYSEGL